MPSSRLALVRLVFGNGAEAYIRGLSHTNTMVSFNRGPYVVTVHLFQEQCCSWMQKLILKRYPALPFNYMRLFFNAREFAGAPFVCTLVCAYACTIARMYACTHV